MSESAGELTVEISGRDVNLTALLERIEQQLTRADAAGQRTGQSLGDSVGGGAQRASSGALAMQQALARLELQQAKLAKAQGDTARAAELETSAEQRLTAALAQQETTTTQTVNAQRQLAQIQTQAAGGMGGLNGAASQLGGNLGALAAATGPVAAGMVGLKVAEQVGQFAVLGSQVDQARGSFDKLATQAGTTGDALLTALRGAAHGEISDMNLELAASRAQILGVAHSTEDFSGLMEIARSRAQLLGTSTTSAFDDLVTGLGRGSKLILDNLGIIVNADEANKKYAASLHKNAAALTDAEKKQALINAVLEQGRQTIAQTGGAVETTAATYARLGAAWENAKNTLASLVGQGLEPAARGLSRLLEGSTGIDQAMHAVSDSIREGGNATAYLAQAFGISAESADYARQFLESHGLIAAADAQATQQNAAAALQSADAQQAATTAVQGSIIAQQSATAATLAESQAKEASTAQSQLLDAQIRALGDSYLALNPNITEAGVDSAVAAGKIDQAVGTYINMVLATERAKVALAALQGQAGVSGGTSVSEGRSDRDRPGDLAQARAAGLAAARDRADEAAAAEARYQKALGNNGPALARARSELAQLTKGSAAYYDKLTEINALEDGKGKKKTGGGASKLSDQQRLNNSLLADQEKYQDKYDDLDLKHAQKRLDIQRSFAEKMRAAQAEFDQNNLDGRASFYDNLGSIENAKIRQSASAAYEAAAAEAGKIAQEKGADVADKYMAAQEKVISDRAKRQAEIEKAEHGDKDGKGKDPALAEYLKGVDALYRAAEERKLQTIKEGGDSLAAQRDADLRKEDAAYEEQGGKLADSAERSAERRIAAAQRAGKAVDGELAKAEQLGAAYAKVAPAAATGSGSAVPAPAPAASAQSSDVLGALTAIKDAVDAAAEKIARAEQDTARAVKARGNGGVAG